MSQHPQHPQPSQSFSPEYLQQWAQAIETREILVSRREFQCAQWEQHLQQQQRNNVGRRMHQPSAVQPQHQEQPPQDQSQAQPQYVHYQSVRGGGGNRSRENGNSSNRGGRGRAQKSSSATTTTSTSPPKWYNKVNAATSYNSAASITNVVDNANPYSSLEVEAMDNASD